MTPLMHALQEFAVAEANLTKLERLWEELQQLIPTGISFGENPDYEDRSRSFSAVLAALPAIDSWKPKVTPPDLDDVAQNRFDAMDVGEPLARVYVENWVSAPGKEIREYRFRLNQKRRALVRDALVDLIDQIDENLRAIRVEVGPEEDRSGKITSSLWEELRTHVDQVEVLLGSSIPRPHRWSDLQRHLHFAQIGDLNDIESMDWPKAKEGLRQGLYGINEPLPSATKDLSDLVAAKPRGAITIKLNWAQLDDEGFERLMFALISSEPGYENPQWLMKTRAPDRGRDLSVTRVTTDGLSGTARKRVVIQCKHWLTKSVALQEASGAKEQMALWPNPRVDVLAIATSGRFTADAVQWIEQHNAGVTHLAIEMWPESHLERLLAARPALIPEFKLR